jgi:hypothetical protein
LIQLSVAEPGKRISAWMTRTRMFIQGSKLESGSGKLPDKGHYR